MAKGERFNTVLLINPPGKVYIYPDGSPAHRKHCTPPLGLAYLAACSITFERNNAGVYQTLAMKRVRGPGGLPPTRADLYR